MRTRCSYACILTVILFLLSCAGGVNAGQRLVSSSRSSTIPEAGNAPGTAPEVPCPGKVRAYLHKGDYDTFKFYFPGGQLSLRSEGDIDLVAELFDEKWSRLMRSGHGDQKNFSFRIDLKPGIYYVHVHAKNNAAGGFYRLVLGDGTGPETKERNP